MLCGVVCRQQLAALEEPASAELWESSLRPLSFVARASMNSQSTVFKCSFPETDHLRRPKSMRVSYLGLVVAFGSWALILESGCASERSPSFVAGNSVAAPWPTVKISSEHGFRRLEFLKFVAWGLEGCCAWPRGLAKSCAAVLPCRSAVDSRLGSGTLCQISECAQCTFPQHENPCQGLPFRDAGRSEEDADGVPRDSCTRGSENAEAFAG